MKTRTFIAQVLLSLFVSMSFSSIVVAQDVIDPFEMELSGSAFGAFKRLEYTDGQIQRIDYETVVSIDITANNPMLQGDVYVYNIANYEGFARFVATAADTFFQQVEILEIDRQTNVGADTGFLHYSPSKNRVVFARLDFPPIVTTPDDPYRIEYWGFEPTDLDTVIYYIRLPSKWHFDEAYRMRGGITLDPNEKLITGIARDVRINEDVSNLTSPFLEGAQADLKRDGVTEQSTFTSSVGSFSFGNIETNVGYDISFTIERSVDDTDDVVKMDTEVTNVIGGENVEVALPVTIFVDKYKTLNKLENLEIDSKLLFGLLPPIPLVCVTQDGCLADYDEAIARALLAKWLNELGDDSEEIVESVARLSISEGVVEILFDDASTMSHELATSLFDIVKGTMASREVVGKTRAALEQFFKNASVVT